VTHLVLLNTAPASCTDATELRHELARRRTADQTRRMTELRSSPAFAAGDIATDAAYYRIHYGSTIGDAALLDDLIGRLRRSCAPRGVQVARAIEDQLIADTWSRPDYDLVPQLAGLPSPPSPSTATTTSSRSAPSSASSTPSPAPSSSRCARAATSATSSTRTTSSPRSPRCCVDPPAAAPRATTSGHLARTGAVRRTVRHVRHQDDRDQTGGGLGRRRASVASRG
jgi:hypothetical protein